jgi:hypothetical protein
VTDQLRFRNLNTDINFMSVAEMIMRNNEQQSQSWSVLSDNLGKLGQQVGQQLAMREYQKQAAEALPAMQAAYKSAMDDVAAGEVATGYQKFIDAQLQFGTSQNPFIADAANNVGGGFTNFVKILESQKQRQAQYGGGVAGPSGLDRLRGGTIVEPASLPVLSAQEASPEQAIASYEDQTRYGAPTVDMEEEPYDTDLREAQIAEQIQTNPDLTQEQKQFAPQVLQHQKRNPAQKIEALNESTTETVDSGFERVKVSGLEKIYPNLTGELGIPQVGTITKIKETIATSDAPGSKINYTYTPVEKEVGESLYNHNMETYKTMGKAVNKMLNQAPIDSKEKFVNLFEKNGGIENAVVSPTTDPEIFNLFFNGNDKDQYEITSKQAEDIGIVQSIPATGGSGIRFVGTPKAPAAQPAAAGGLPAVQAQAPAALSAPEIPEEAAGLQQIVAQGQAAKAGEQAKVTEKRIKDIDAEIKRLSSPYIQGTRREGGMTIAGYAAPVSSRSRSKTADEAESDIKKITKLKSEKDALLGKKPLTQQEIKNGAIVEQGGKKYRFTNGKYIPID